MNQLIKYTVISLLLSIFHFGFSQSKEYEKALSKIDKRGEVFVKIFANPNLDAMVLSQISVDEVGYDFVNAYLNSKTLDLIEKSNFQYEVIMSAGELFQQSQETKSYSYNQYPSYYQYDSLMHAFQQNYPDLCELQIIGKLNSGKEIMVIKISDSVNVEKDKPKFLYTSSMHGNELVGYVLMLRLIDYLAANYKKDSLVTHLLNKVEIYINPLANPNGAYYVSDNSVSGATRFNLNSVDLNRNFPDPRQGSHPDGNLWQEETQIFMDFADSINFVLSSNIHGGVEVINYPWDTWSRRVADDLWWQHHSRAYVDTVYKYSPANYFSGFNNGITNGYDWYPVAGGRQDYMNYFHNCREMTLELSNEKLPPESMLDSFWEYNYRSLLYYINSVTYGLKGFISDSLTNNPLRAKVRILNYDIDSSFVYSSEKTGDYHRMLLTGYYKIEFSCDEYETKIVDSVFVKSNSLSLLDVELVKKTIIPPDSNLINLKVYPNPIISEINFDFESSFITCEVSIFDINSKLIEKVKSKNQNSFKLNLDNYNSGVYFLKLNVDEKMIIRKKIIKI